MNLLNICIDTISLVAFSIDEGIVDSGKKFKLLASKANNKIMYICWSGF